MTNLAKMAAALLLALACVDVAAQQDSARQDRAQQDRARQDGAQQDSARQDGAQQDRAQQDSAHAAPKSADDNVYVTARLHPDAKATEQAKAAGAGGAQASTQAGTQAGATLDPAALAKARADAKMIAEGDAKLAAEAAEQDKAAPAKPKGPPRHAVRENIAVMPSPPQPLPSDTYRPAPVPRAPAPLSPPAPVQILGCDGGGCNASDGKRYNGNGTTLIGPQGKLCTRNGTSVQCF